MPCSRIARNGPKILVEAPEHAFTLFFAEVEAGHRGCVYDNLRRNRLTLLSLGPKNAGKQCAAQPHARHIGHERSAIERWGGRGGSGLRHCPSLSQPRVSKGPRRTHTVTPAPRGRKLLHCGSAKASIGWAAAHHRGGLKTLPTGALTDVVKRRGEPS